MAEPQTNWSSAFFSRRYSVPQTPSFRNTLTSLDTDQESQPAICRLPPEILQHILSFLECQHLVSLIRTCRILKNQAENELLWVDLLKLQLPPWDIPSVPAPFPSFKQLYLTHHPYWFLSRYKIWFADEPYTGKLILIKYDKRRGCVEGYRVASQRGMMSARIWEYKPSVFIHNFNPRLYISQEDPVLSFPKDVVPFNVKGGWWEGEIRMKVGSPSSKINASFSLSRDMPERSMSPSMKVWPPTTIPRMPRTRAFSGDRFKSKGHKPERYEQISQTTFRLRTWSHFIQGIVPLGVRINEEVSTWSTVDPALYTPTKEKPYQGIFVGDYSGHGCEFLLIMQTERALSTPTRSDSTRNITREVWNAMQENFGDLGDEQEARPATPNLNDDNVHKGALEAIKLTGDDNVPRGEHTFIAEDIGRAGLLRIAHEEPFKGARVVLSWGHIAASGFQNDEFIPSQLIMVSPDLLAQYWVQWSFISYYRRVPIDELLAGVATPRRASE